MPLPPTTDALVTKRCNELIAEAEQLLPRIAQEDRQLKAEAAARGVLYGGEIHNSSAEITSLVEKSISLIQMILGNTRRAEELCIKVGRDKSVDSSTVKTCLGILRALQSDYSSGMLESLHQQIETNVIADYMGQAERLLQESHKGQHDHVPAAVLTGAVLEDALRRLCLRHQPLISVTKPNGDSKTLTPLIEDLQKAQLFSKAKADLLKGWAKIRNFAAHGEFTQFNRSDVEIMIQGIKQFLADYL